MTKWTIYSSAQTALFLMGDQPVHLSCVDVARIQFQPKGVLHLRGMLPMRRDLLEIKDGAAFEIVFNPDGSHVEYGHPRTVPLFKVTNCRVTSRYIKEAILHNTDATMFVEVVFMCDIEILNWESA